MAETDFPGPVKRGDHGPAVKKVQEWLSLHRFGTSIDGDFGPASELTVKTFQGKKELAVTGVVDQTVFSALVLPMMNALTPIAAGGHSLPDLVVAYARQHLAQEPLEVGGENSGPWVRLYMAGNEGKPWPWCAGFSTFVLRQSCQTLGVSMPHPYAFGCDFLAGVASQNGKLQRGGAPKPGWLFLVRKAPNHWQHIGIVESVKGEVMTTIEGNTNDSGSPEGFEVCRRTRGLADKDYLIV